MQVDNRRRLLAIPASLALGAIACTGCAVGDVEFDRAHLSARIAAATGHPIRDHDTAGEIPPGVNVDDGVEEEEAVAIALWNNPDFDSAITELGLRRADLVAAGVLRNPLFSLLFPLGPKQLEFTLTFPLEALIHRPSRIAAAELECERVGNLLVQGGLDLVRDVRSALADLWLARQRVELGERTAALLERRVRLMEIRLEAGDVGETEVDRSRLRATEAIRSLASATRDLELAEIRMRGLLGLAGDSRPLSFVVAPPPAVAPLSETEALVRRALATRPEMRAAEIAVEAAVERAALSSREWMKIAAIYDANGEGTEGFESGPGLSLDVPLFDLGGAKSAQAHAELEAALKRRASVRARISREVAEARAHSVLAREGLEIVVDRMVPTATAAAERAMQAVRLGAEAPMVGIDAELEVARAIELQVELATDVRKADAELERCSGPITADTGNP